MTSSAGPRGVLLMSNDMLTPFAKTTDYLADALERRGIPAYVRDNAESRLLSFLFSEEMEPKAPRAQAAIRAAMRELIDEAGIDTVLSLDLNWYVTPGLFVDDPAIRSVHSLWFDDFRSWCTASMNGIFPVDGDEFQRHVRHPKVVHHFYGDSQALEARLLGVTSQRLTRLAAPRHLLETDAPCTRRDRLAFVGNPGFRGAPHPEAVRLIQQGADIPELRAFCRNAMLKHPRAARAGVVCRGADHAPAVRRGAGGARRPSLPACAADRAAGRQYPRAFDYANEKGIILDLAFMVKLVNRYDRPAFIHRLWKRGWIDVYSAADEWRPYGVEALPY
ncbi:MAG: hypothetical protein WDO13_06095 [Verrucomicrobiota bacterium]